MWKKVKSFCRGVAKFVCGVIMPTTTALYTSIAYKAALVGMGVAVMPATAIAAVVGVVVLVSAMYIFYIMLPGYKLNKENG